MLFLVKIMAARICSGRTITESDMRMIRWATEKYPGLARTELAGTICELIGWLTPSGNAKKAQCLALLKELESEGELSPPPASGTVGGARKAKFIQIEPPPEEVTDIGEVRLEIVRGNGLEALRWRSCIEQYHMLGSRQEFGSRLRYFIKDGDRELGCMMFSASAWALEARDAWIGWDAPARKERLHLIVSNSRFLILPWVRTPNLASRSLALAARRIGADWMEEFGYSPVLLETFVDTEHFRGTCYKAANWTYLGETKGRGRMDRHTRKALPAKAIYVYPLRRDFRAILCGTKPAPEGAEV
jgi:hypothetical protein